MESYDTCAIARSQQLRKYSTKISQQKYKVNWSLGDANLNRVISYLKKYIYDKYTIENWTAVEQTSNELKLIWKQ